MYRNNISIIRLTRPDHLTTVDSNKKSRKISFPSIKIALTGGLQPDPLFGRQPYNGMTRRHVRIGVRRSCEGPAHPYPLRQHFHLGAEEGRVDGRRGGDEEVGPVVRGGELSRGAVVGVAMVTADRGQDEAVPWLEVLAEGQLGVEADPLAWGGCPQ